MSNELSSPKILVCPQDKHRHAATNFNARLMADNLSYFVNPDSNEANPQDIMSGDDNLEIRGVRVKSGLLIITSNTPIAWTADRHRLSGNIGMADGSVQGVSNLGLTNYLFSTNTAGLRLAIP
jgi:prepilin-type processing-associated H-X9-DG protein